ncbi:hypothetical protein ACWCL1_08125 [Ligilactobacillus sp. LYQ135]
MKKVKKIVIPMLMILCIPLFLAGCNLGTKAPAKSEGQVWYLIDDGYIDNIVVFHGNTVTDYYGVDADYTAKLIGKNEKEIKKIAKKYDIESTTYDIDYNVYVDNDNKGVEEAIMESDSNDCFTALKDAGTTVKVNGKVLTGFKTVETPSGSEPTLHSDEYLVTDSKKVDFDNGKDSKDVKTFNASDLNTVSDD